MKYALIFFALSFCSFGYAQYNDKISTMDFVQILNNNKEETVYYYQNNWKILREKALKKGYIHSFQLLETPPGKEEPFEIILITTYLNKKQYDQREQHFSEIMKENGKLKLMNEKEPKDFRKTLFSREMVRHWK